MNTGFKNLDKIFNIEQSQLVLLTGNRMVDMLSGDIANGRLDRNVTFYRVEEFRGNGTEEDNKGCDRMCEVVEEFGISKYFKK